MPRGCWRLALGVLLFASVGGLAQPDLLGEDDDAPSDDLGRREADDVPSTANSNAALLTEDVEVGSGQSARLSKILREVRAAARQASSVMRGHPRQQRKLQTLLRGAARMAAKAAESNTMAESARAAFAEVVHQEQQLVGHKSSSKSAVGEAAVSASGSSQAQDMQHELHHFLSGMAKVTEADRQTLAESQDVENEVVQTLGGEDPDTAAEVSQLLDTVQAEQRRVMARDSHAMHVARKEARLLARQQTHASSATQRKEALLLAGGTHTEQARAQETTRSAAAGALLNYASGVARVAAEDRQMLSQTEQAKDDIESALGGEDTDFGQRAAGALERVEAAQRAVLSSEGHELRQARGEVQQLEEGQEVRAPRRERTVPLAPEASATQAADVQQLEEGQEIRAPHRERTVPLAPEASAPQAADARMNKLQMAVEGHSNFASREAHLAKVGRTLASEMSKMRHEVAELVRESGGENPKVSYELNARLGSAQRLMWELTGFHSQMVEEAKQKVERLHRLEHQLEESRGTRHHRRHRGGRHRHAVHRAGDASFAQAASHRAAAELRGSRRILMETEQAEAAVRSSVHGPGAAAVRADVERLLKGARRVEIAAIAVERKELRRAKSEAAGRV